MEFLVHGQAKDASNRKFRNMMVISPVNANT